MTGFNPANGHAFHLVRAHGKHSAEISRSTPPATQFAQGLRQLYFRHLTENFLRVLNWNARQIFCREDFHTFKNFVLVCRSVLAYRDFPLRSLSPGAVLL